MACKHNQAYLKTLSRNEQGEFSTFGVFLFRYITRYGGCSVNFKKMAGTLNNFSWKAWKTWISMSCEANIFKSNASTKALVLMIFLKNFYQISLRFLSKRQKAEWRYSELMLRTAIMVLPIRVYPAVVVGEDAQQRPGKIGLLITHSTPIISCVTSSSN